MHDTHDLTRRSLQPELMDAPVAAPEKYDDIIRQIESINALTGGYRPVLSWLKNQLSSAEDRHTLTLVDLGCGRGSLLREIAQRFHGRNLKLTGLDNNPLAIKAAQKATPEEVVIEYRVEDAFAEDLPAADFIICSHTTHHMTDDEVMDLLHLLQRKATRGWFICDLHRHRIAYLITKALLSVLPVDKMVAHDGPLSVRRAFRHEDWQRLIDEALLSLPVKVEWYFPFRYGVSSERMGHEEL